MELSLIHICKQYWTESAERVGIIEKVMNDGSISSTFNEGMMKVEGETAYCIDINTDFKNGYKTRADASSRMSADQISDVALSLEYVKQYGEAHKELNLSLIHICQLAVAPLLNHDVRAVLLGQGLEVRNLSGDSLLTQMCIRDSFLHR